MAAELRVLLVELTGSIVVTRLGRLAPFRKWGIDFSDGREMTEQAALLERLSTGSSPLG